MSEPPASVKIKRIQLVLNLSISRIWLNHYWYFFINRGSRWSRMATKRVLIRYRRLEGKSQIIQNQNQVHRKWCGMMFLFPFRACKCQWISIGPRVPAFENHHHPKMDRTIPSQIHVSKVILNLSPHNFERSFSSIRIAKFQVAPLANAGITGTPIGFGRPWRVTCVTCHYTCLLLLQTFPRARKKQAGIDRTARARQARQRHPPPWFRTGYTMRSSRKGIGRDELMSSTFWYYIILERLNGVGGSNEHIGQFSYQSVSFDFGPNSFLGYV